MNEDSNKYFPKHFFWGASSSAHQLEGGNTNQWSEWERVHAKEFAQLAHTRISWLPKWDEIKDQAQSPENYISGEGVEHFSRYKEDFEIIRELKLNAFRFGIEWSRIEPEEGQWNESAIEHYREYIRELRSRRIEPFANLWHWTEPVWFARLGGFKKRKNISYFTRFIQKIADELVEDLTYIITLNEPNVYTTFSYIVGEWPPEEKSLWAGQKVYRNLIKAHRESYYVLKRAKPQLQIGIAAQLANIQSKRPHNLIDTTATKWMRYYWNWWFLNRCRKEQDFIGFNYYFSDYYRGFWRDNPKVPLSDMGWYMEPEGLYPLLLRTWSHYKKPIFVTENGLADAKDEYRRWWLEETIVAMQKAVSEGVDLRGYFHWSLLDNFEWKYGWWPKFGLVAVDRKNNMKRTIRPSAKWFAKRIEKIHHE